MNKGLKLSNGDRVFLNATDNNSISDFRMTNKVLYSYVILMDNLEISYTKERSDDCNFTQLSRF